MEHNALSHASARPATPPPAPRPALRLMAQVFLDSADPILIEDLDGRVLDLNTEAERVYGWSRAELLGKPSKILLPPEYHGQIDELLQRCRAGERVRNVESLRLTKSGRVHPVLITLSLLRDAAGLPMAAASLIKDVTEPEHAWLKNELAAELAGMTRLHALSATLMQPRDLPGQLDAILDTAVHVSNADKGKIQLLDDPTGTLHIVAQRGFEAPFLTFFSRVHEALGSSCGAALQQGERVVVEDVAQSAIFEGTPARQVMLTAGARAVQSTPLISHDGRLLGVLSTHYAAPHRPTNRELRLIDLLARQAADAIAHMQAEAALHESEERFRTLADNIAQFAWMADETGWIFWYNKRWFAYTGTTLEEMQGWGWKQVHHPAHVDRVVARIQRSWETGEPWEDVFPLRGKDGEYRWFLSRALPIRDDRGRIVRWFGTNTDVTEQRQAREALQQAYDELEQRVAERTADLQQAHDDLRREMAERQRMQEALFQQEKLAALGTLLANVAHELNNPLAVAAMQIDSLHEAWGAGPWAEDLETLQQAVERCSSVVQSFLALARQQPPTRSAVALNAVIENVLALLAHALQVDDITVHRHLAEDLPQLWADAHQLYHVVVNLVTNAHQALRGTAPPRHLTLTTTAKAERTQVTLEVADTGPGVSEALQRRVFDPFFTTKPQGVGSGLGLPLCRNIVEGHGGTIHLAGQPGHGTTVSVTLPVGTPVRPIPEAPPEPAAPAPTARASILLIDDELGVQRALRRLLQRSGHDIATAANGREGLAALEARSYDVILCDMRMPDLDGPGLYHEMARRYPHLLPRVVFLTGDVLGPEAQAFFAQVDRPRLVKPFRAQEVRRVIQQVLAAR